MPRILFVSGFHPATRAKDLAYEFERYGPLVRCDVPAPRNPHATHNPYAFVEFRSARDADEAYYEMHGRNFEGSRLSIQWAKNPPSSVWRYDRRSPPRRPARRSSRSRSRSPPPRRRDVRDRERDRDRDFDRDAGPPPQGPPPRRRRSRSRSPLDAGSRRRSASPERRRDDRERDRDGRGGERDLRDGGRDRAGGRRSPPPNGPSNGYNNNGNNGNTNGNGPRDDERDREPRDRPQSPYAN